ncbi:MAG: hypothetical protein Ct9H300mP19_16440 [Dehalococcoidia bacterium]|nr:MAG: hypothetical protein Ct9H300mP19_16440 [Dehalococcoidia bacterium]
MQMFPWSGYGTDVMEPQVDILMPDGVRVFYGNVEPSEAQEIVLNMSTKGKTSP